MALKPAPIALSLGPLYFNWPSAQVLDFYARIADECPVERVYLGEIVCGKRAPLTQAAIASAAERLERGGKTVIWSTLISPVNRRERRLTEELAADGEHVELNDFGGLASRGGGAFTAGPFLNVYNESTASMLQQMGCTRWCPPVELSLPAIAEIATHCPGLEIELFGFGRLPLAHSGRCYHARQHGLNRDSCRYVCEQDPDGCRVSTLDGTAFLAFNGVQTLSDGLQLCTETPDGLRQAGISALRLSPHSVGMVEVAVALRRYFDGQTALGEMVETVRASTLPLPLVNGYLAGKAGLEWTIP
ncbi:ubiquinone anaerobic biosynthesis protein UbiV [Maricaulis sp.]|uniref:ubiquinone anaerobic biosynthesis protein UbiV n=1 Tax=Maricaulis sp. TaxID=1486257 RepID=UPI003A956BDA